MPNANTPFGLSPVRHVSGAPYNGQCNLYCILAANTNGFAIGDPVISGGSANALGTIPNIDIAGVTGAIRGVIVGLSDTYPGNAKIGNPNSIVRPAAAQSGDWYALVCDDPDVLYEIQEIGTGTPLTVAAIGLNANLESGTNNGYVSGWMLGNDDEATTATLQVRIVSIVNRPDNALGQYCKYLVKINVAELGTGTGAAGV